MRAFVSMEIPEAIKAEIEKIQHQLPEFNGKLTERNNLHLTLKFLGEISPMLVDNVKSKLSSIKFTTLNLKIKDIGTFSYQGMPGIVWLKIEGAEGLQKKIDAALADLFPKEERFMSHLTIARIKLVSYSDNFKQKIEKIKYPLLNFETKSFSLKKSTLTKNGPIYETIKEYRCSQ